MDYLQLLPESFAAAVCAVDPAAVIAAHLPPRRRGILAAWREIEKAEQAAR